MLLATSRQPPLGPRMNMSRLPPHPGHRGPHAHESSLDFGHSIRSAHESYLGNLGQGNRVPPPLPPPGAGVCVATAAPRTTAKRITKRIWERGLVRSLAQQIPLAKEIEVIILSNVEYHLETLESKT